MATADVPMPSVLDDALGAMREAVGRLATPSPAADAAWVAKQLEPVWLALPLIDASLQRTDDAIQDMVVAADDDAIHEQTQPKVAAILPELCRMLALLIDGRRAAKPLPRRAARKTYVAAANDLIDRLVVMIRLLATTWPELVDQVPEDLTEVVWTFRIPWWAQLRAMADLFWSAIRYPRSAPTIDLSTGRVLYRTPFNNGADGD